MTVKISTWNEFCSHANTFMLALAGGDKALAEEAQSKIKQDMNDLLKHINDKNSEDENAEWTQ